jgi:hypothetical protein
MCKGNLNNPSYVYLNSPLFFTPPPPSPSPSPSPREVRATFNGISAACGKLGAFTGVYVFGPLAETTSYATGEQRVEGS